MIMDKNLEFSSGQVVTSTAASTNIVDALKKGDDYANIFAFVRCATTATAGGAATLVVSIETAIDAAFTSPVTLLQSAAIPVASLVAGAELLKARLPIGVLEFIRVKYTVATGPLTAGAFDAALVMDVQQLIN